MRNKYYILKHLLPTPPFFLGSASLPIFFTSSPHPEWHRGMGNGGCGEFITRCLCCSFLLSGGLLILCLCSSVGFLPQETVLQELLQCGSSPWAAALHTLPQCGSFPWGAVLQEQAAPVWDPHGVTRPASKPAPLWAPLSTGPQVLAGACSSTGSPRGHGLLWSSSCSSVGSSTGCGWGSAPPWATMGCKGQPASPWSAPRATGEPLLRCLEHLLPSLCTDRGLFRVVALSYSHSLGLQLHRFFFPLHKHILPEALPPLLMGSPFPSAGSVLELAALRSMGRRGNFQQPSLQNPATMTLPHKPNTSSHLKTRLMLLVFRLLFFFSPFSYCSDARKAFAALLFILSHFHAQLKAICFHVKIILLPK